MMMQMEDMRLQIAALKDHSDKKSAMVGAGVLFSGIVLGLVLAGGRRRKGGLG